MSGGDSYCLGLESIGHCNEYFRSVYHGPGTARASCKGAKVHGIDLEKVKDPWLSAWFCNVLDGQNLAEVGLVVLAEFPNYEFIVTSMAA